MQQGGVLLLFEKLLLRCGDSASVEITISFLLAGEQQLIRKDILRTEGKNRHVPSFQISEPNTDVPKAPD